MTYFVGIDPASESFVALVYTTPDGPSLSPHSFSNDPEGFEAFKDWVDEASIPKEAVLVLIENTGVYSEALCYALDRQGFDLVLVDPRAVWRAFDQERKTDALDCRRLAEYGYRYRDRLVLWEPHEAVVEQIKTLLSTREQLVQHKTAARNARQSLSRKAIQTQGHSDAAD
jgi:transposase